MKLEDQVCSLELSLKLRKLGITIPSYFVWYEAPASNSWDIVRTERFIDDGAKQRSIPAFTVAELGEILIGYKHNFFPYFCDNPRELVWVYNFGAYPEHVLAKTEADCRAKMLIHLIENKLITPPQNAHQ